MVVPSPYNSGHKARRDHRGNLMGGAMNMSMQRHQQCETLEEKEHKRWLAHRDAALAATFPTALEFNGISIPIFKVGELAPIGGSRLRQRALNLRDRVNATKSRFFDHYPRLTLNPNAAEELLIKWMVDVQVELAKALGIEDLDHAAFGASTKPELWQRPTEVTPSGYQNRPEPAWSQHGINDGKQPQVRPKAQAHDGSPPRSFPWSQHGVNDERMGSWRDAPPTHQGFSLVPPHLQSGGRVDQHDMGRFDDAAHIRHRGHGSAFVLG